MKISTIIICLLLLLLVVNFGWSSYDYSLQCTKCLADKHVVENCFLGVTYSSSTKDRDPAKDYQRIFGRPCEHLFHKGGFGRSTAGGVSCGMTSEGIIFSARNSAALAVYAAEERLRDMNLALETFGFIDTRVSPDIKMEHWRRLPENVLPGLFTLSSLLPLAETTEEWRTILHAAQDDFRDVSSLPAHVRDQFGK